MRIDTADVDDPPPPAATIAGRNLAGLEHRLEVDGQDAVPIGFGGIEERAPALIPPRSPEYPPGRSAERSVSRFSSDARGNIHNAVASPPTECSIAFTRVLQPSSVRSATMT